jgi:hypothetical protein
MKFITILGADQDCLFQQRKADSTTQVLWEFFGDRIISGNLWPRHSPYLSPPDFYLWGVLKENMYKNNPRSLEELQQNTELRSNSLPGCIKHKEE